MSTVISELDLSSAPPDGSRAVRVVPAPRTTQEADRFTTNRPGHPAGHPAGPGVRHLLRSAVGLQAEILLRSIGARVTTEQLTVIPPDAGRRDPDTDTDTDTVDWAARIEHDLRDLEALARAALAAGANLPTGMDAAVGEPEGITQSARACDRELVRALAELVARGADDAPWGDAVVRVMARRGPGCPGAGDRESGEPVGDLHRMTAGGRRAPWR